jgi:hypothetical protein
VALRQESQGRVQRKQEPDFGKVFAGQLVRQLP